MFTSQSELELARQTFRYYKPKQELNVGYGIPAPTINNTEIKDVFRNTIPGLKDRPYILFLSRIHEKKGLGLLIEAYKDIIRNKNADGQLGAEILPCLVIVGPGWDEPFGQKINSAILAEPLFTNQVFTHGMVSGSVKWSALKNADVFILPSHQENFGIAVAEALACGKPVLITNQINIWNEIEQDGAGIVKSDTLEGVRDLLLDWLCLKASDQVLMGENALKCFNNRYNIYKPTISLLKAIE